MNNTILILLGVVVVVLLMKKPAIPQAAADQPTPNGGGKQVDSPGETFADVVGAMASAIGKITNTVNTRTQRNGVATA